jgi:hypothetical protein
MLKRLNIRVVYTLLSALFIILGTFLAIQYAKGNYRMTKKGFVPESGLLSANSFPPGAEIYVNDKLISATDDTIYLEPGDYKVKIAKEGYSPWEKQLKLEKELVTQTNAVLFPQVPSLTPLTFAGVQNVSPSPDGQKIIFYTSSSSAEAKNGLYILDLINNQLSLQKGPRQISQNTGNIHLNQSLYIWSPDSTELLINAPNDNSSKEILLDVDKKTDLTTGPDLTFQKKQLLAKWQEEMYIRERQFLGKFPDKMIEIATTSANNIYLSPEKKRMIYTATVSATIPDRLIPPVLATNTQPESRTLEPGNIYIYDKEEDRNFKVGMEKKDPNAPIKHSLATDLYNREALTYEGSPSAFLSLQATNSAQTVKNFTTYHSSLYVNTFQWFPDSKHLIYTTDDEIHIMEYDGTNDTVVYSGPFSNHFVYPWPDGSKLIMLTSFSPNSPLNLYALELKK